MAKEEDPHCYLTWLASGGPLLPPPGPRWSDPVALSHLIKQEHPQPPPAVESSCAV